MLYQREGSRERGFSSILSENFIWKTNSIFSIFSKLDSDSHNLSIAMIYFYIK